MILVAITGFNLLLAVAVIEGVLIVALATALARARNGGGDKDLPTVPAYKFEVTSEFPNEVQVSPDEKTAEMKITLAMNGPDVNWVATDVSVYVGRNDLGDNMTVGGKPEDSEELRLDFGEVKPNEPATKAVLVKTGAFAQMELDPRTSLETTHSADTRPYTLPTRIEYKLKALHVTSRDGTEDCNDLTITVAD